MQFGYILNIEKAANIFFCCDIENSFAPATTNRASEVQSRVNLLRPTASPANSDIKVLIFPSVINIM